MTASDERPTARGRREAQRERLLAAAEQRIAEAGLEALKARDLATDLGIALGGLYNLVPDMDSLLLLVSSRTLARLDVAEEAAAGAMPLDTAQQAMDRLAVVGRTYLEFASQNLRLWRAVFQLRIAGPLPPWQAEQQLRLFRHIAVPLGKISPELDEEAIAARARTLFAAVHGLVAVGLEERLISTPLDKLSDEIDWVLRTLCNR